MSSIAKQESCTNGRVSFLCTAFLFRKADGMNELEVLLQRILNEKLRQIVLSDSEKKETASKVKIRPVLIKGGLLFQETVYKGNQVFHKNGTKEETIVRIKQWLDGIFHQAAVMAEEENAVVLISKKGRMTIKVQKAKEKVQKAPTVIEHNREKQYILREGIPVDFLVGLGVQTTEGKITKARYDKFRQINRYLEFIEDILEKLPKDRPIRIVDFGCGKSYLTFAMYYYLHELKKRELSVTGLDLKADVIDSCSRLALQCGYENLHFEKGDISSYEGADRVDMVVSLHACDTATDYALEKAVKWGAKVIFAVPCCQHEVNRQIHCKELANVFRYGLIKERMSALITDAVRADLLERQGYETQILEFIDMEHTPKNLLIRAVKKEGRFRAQKGSDIRELLDFLQINPTLFRLLEGQESVQGSKAIRGNG